MGSIRVAISESALCVFGLFWSGCVYDYCFIVFSLTFVAWRGGKREVVSGVSVWRRPLCLSVGTVL